MEETRGLIVASVRYQDTDLKVALVKNVFGLYNCNSLIVCWLHYRIINLLSL